MKKLTAKESQEIVITFLETIKKGLKKQNANIEFFEVKQQKPHYELLSCAYIQTPNLKEGILYEGATNRIIHLKADKKGVPVLSDLSKTVSDQFPPKMMEKMFWVCGNKTDKVLELADLGDGFTLVKPSKI